MPFLAPALVAASMSVVHADGPFLFSPTVVSFEGSHFPTMIATGDLDGDGDLDIVVPGRNSDGIAYVVFNEGDGTFATPVPLEIEKHCDSARIIDLDGDGAADICFSIRSFHGEIRIFWGVGDGSFEEENLLLRLGREPRSLEVVDLDGDGDRDLAAINHQSDDVQIILNEGGRVFGEASRIPVGRESVPLTGLQQLKAADLDDDGDIDLAAIATGSGRIHFLRNRGDATFEIPEGWLAPKVGKEYAGITDLALGDIDLDGDLDFAMPMILIDAPSHFGVLRNDSNMQVERRDAHLVADVGYGFSVALGDLDSDGDLDALVGCAIPGKLNVLDNRTVPIKDGGDGSLAFEPFQSIANRSFMRGLACVDIDQDCDIDVLAVDLVSHDLIVYRNLTPQANGCGGLPLVAEASIAPEPGGDEPQAIGLLQDLDQNGRIDAADLALTLALQGGSRP
ncbi:MAG: FG-GAP-like repeat-containing protein [Phycisphaerales bacterium]|nr:FG-GAP-like repeat-containing protein [Phycisphaerales bacterium]